MGMRLEDVAEKHKNFQPGPGNYEINRSLTKPSTRFGTSQRGSMHSKSVMEVPGPGNYTNSTALLHSAPKFGFGSSTRQNFQQKSVSPGPGAYK